LVSIVIPVRRDAEALRRLLAQLLPRPEVEVIVAATTESDAGISALAAARPDVRWAWASQPGRGPQQNAGAAVAAGRWLWFVHADSRVPPGYVETFAAIDRGDETVGGAFRFALDSPRWQARVWERGVAARVWWLGLPYGDQGLFVRRTVFERMGGFAPLPLMEDVEFVGRLKREGRIRHLTEKLVTSARRWEQEGWWRRSARNLGLLALYYCGVSPHALEKRYTRRR
jgi:rSAM/selenodomain-associated transferase 2